MSAPPSDPRPPAESVNPTLEFLPHGLGILVALAAAQAAARGQALGDSGEGVLARPLAGVVIGAAFGVVATALSTLVLPLFTELRPRPWEARNVLLPLAFLVHFLAFVAFLRSLRVPLPGLVALLLHLPALLLRLLVDAGVLIPPGPLASFLSWLLPPAGFMVDLPVLVEGSIPRGAWKGSLAYGLQVAVFLAVAERSGSHRGRLRRHPSGDPVSLEGEASK